MRILSLPGMMVNSRTSVNREKENQWRRQSFLSLCFSSCFNSCVAKGDPLECHQLCVASFTKEQMLTVIS